MYVFGGVVRAFRDRKTEGVFDDFEFEAAMGSVEHYSVTFPWLFFFFLKKKKKRQKRQQISVGQREDKRWRRNVRSKQ